MRRVGYGCYSPTTFRWETRDGVYSAIVNEFVCPVHGVIFSLLGGVFIPGSTKCHAANTAQGLGIGMVAQWQGSSVGAAAVGVSVGSAVATSRSAGDAVNYSQSSYDSALNPKV